ncbi:GyrI-like domain-containing protein [Streptococcus entericus]|uniref:GyrI-like domain-containing protein n=1 Tax=Streptococcus entericus TaxID=155680 RepID=UPI000367A51E|nr:effector binding domain-containing protein [Streptococcus entericus]
MKFIGIQVKTTNENGQSAQDLGNLWATFMGGNLFAQIPNKTSDEIIVIYTDYESDYQGAYTAMIGASVYNLKTVPDGMIGREFPKQVFKKIIAKGEMPSALMQTWQDIWQNDNALNRTYLYDMEIYGANSQNGNEAEVEIWLGVNEERF